MVAAAAPNTTSCLVCQGNHKRLWSCPKLPTFLPEKGGNISKLPAQMCKGCLQPTKSKPPCHRPGAHFMCTTTGFNKYLCPCAKHDRPRAWLAKNFNPSLGWKNFTNLKQALGAAACRTVVHKVHIGAMKINNCLIGSSHCPSEIISIRQDDGTFFRAKLHYDSGASHCLANKFVKPIVIKQSRSPLPIQLSTINSSSCAIRTLATVEINEIIFSCILVKNLHVDSHTMPIPRAWENYRDNWIG